LERNTQLINEDLIEIVNECYQDSVYNYYTKACQAISKYESELPESTPYLKSVRIYLEALCEMLLDHDIEDLEWSGSFVPSFDWITLQNHQVDAIFCNVFDDCEEDHNYTCGKLFNDLKALQALGVITGLNEFSASDDSLTCGFNIVELDAFPMERFDADFKRLRAAIHNFYSY
jgi:hypothetical protein